MKYSIVYSSQTGNTELLAKEIKKQLPEQDCVYYGVPCPEALNADRIYLGFWTDKGSCDLNSAEFLKALSSQELFLFGTAGFGVSEAYFDTVLNRVKELLPAGVSLKGSFMCQGKMPMSVRERYMSMRNTPGMEERMDGMIKNFDAALSHPDAEDLSELAKALK